MLSTRNTPVEVLLFVQIDLNGPVPVNRPDLGRCWLWNGHTNAKGYGRFASRRLGAGEHRLFLVHRLMYVWLRGAIPDGLEPDHLCRVRRCCNPWHIELVTGRDNTLRGEGPSAINARRAHCAHGHTLDGENTYVNPKGDRHCRACHRAYQANRRRIAREAIGL